MYKIKLSDSDPNFRLCQSLGKGAPPQMNFLPSLWNPYVVED